MICKRCKSEKVHKNGKAFKSGKQKYFCTDCKYNFEEGASLRTSGKLSPSKVGMTLDEFKDKHDIEHIIVKTLKKLEKDMIYTKDDVVKMAGIPYGAQGLTSILEAQMNYYGKTGGKIYYSHPDTIQMLKDKAKLN